MLQALGLSLLTAALSTLLCLVFGVPLAVLLSHSAHWPLVPRRLLRAAITVPLVLPPVVGGIALLLLLGRRGLIGQFLAEVGLGIPYTTGAVVLAQTFVAMPFLVFAVEGALRCRRPAHRVRRGDARRDPVAGVPAGHPAAGRARHRRRRGAVLHPRARRVRRDDHVRRLVARASPAPCRSRSYLAMNSDPDAAIALALVLLAVSVVVLLALRDRWLPGVRA